MAKNNVFKLKGEPVAIQRNALKGSLRELVEKIEIDPDYEGNSSKPYKNKEGLLPGTGPFLEFVAKGSKKRVVLDTSNYAIYVTDNHHRSYQEVE